MYRQCLAQVLLDGFQSVLVSGRVAEPQNPYRGIDQKPAELGVGGIPFSLQQAVYVTNGGGEIIVIYGYFRDYS